MVKPAKLKTKSKPQSLSGLLSVRLLQGLRQSLLVSLPYVLSLTAAGLLFGSVIVYAMSSSTFDLAAVKIVNAGPMTPERAFEFCELRPGENLIHLDLVAVQQVIKRKHPEFKEVRVRRVLPNELEVMLKRRTPLCQAAFGQRFIQLDRDFVLLPGASTAPFRNLPVVKGAPVPPDGLYVGVVLKDDATQKAVKLADVVRQSRVLRGHFLTHVDITDPENFVLLVDNQIEIRLGNGHFMERLKILDQTLKTVLLDASKIKYIDLRFDDVVIGPR